MELTMFFVGLREKSLVAGDYGSYRTVLTRRILSLRKKLGQASIKGRKYTSKAPITGQDIASNHEFAHLLLLLSERAWSHAMYMKSMRAAESNQTITGSTRRHIISRIHKAKTIALNLLNAIESEECPNVEGESILEARAYYISLTGAECIEKQRWDECLIAYSEVRLIYTSLAGSAEPRRRDIFRDLLADTVDPSLRYAAYQLRLPRSLPMGSIVLRYIHRKGNSYVEAILSREPNILQETVVGGPNPSGDDAKIIPSSITWRSRRVELEDASIAQALAAVSFAEEKLAQRLSSNPDSGSQERASMYDDILIASQDAVDATKIAIDELASEGIMQGDRRMQALQITKTAVNYALIGWRIGRNRVLCGTLDGATSETEKMMKSMKPRNDGEENMQQKQSKSKMLSCFRERVVLYDAILQSLDSIRELPGVAADQTILDELESRRAYFAALRCLTIARSHDLIARPKNALAILFRALTLSTRSQSGLSVDSVSAAKPPNLEITSTQIGFLVQLLKAHVSQYRALVEIESLKATTTSATKSADKVPLIERLKEYPLHGADLKNLVLYPPHIEPIPVKPIFLDVAWNYVDYPGRERKYNDINVNGIMDDVTKTDKKKETRRGWFGFGRS